MLFDRPSCSSPSSGSVWSWPAPRPGRARARRAERAELLEPGDSRRVPGGPVAGAPGDLRPARLPLDPAGQVPPGRPLTAVRRHAGRAAGAGPRRHRVGGARPRPGHDRAHGGDRRGQDLARRGARAARGRARRPGLVRPGADEALVEGRFIVDDEEVILARAVPAQGRSRAWIDGRMAPVSALAEVGARLVDLHGQHAHQSLLDRCRRSGAPWTRSPASTSARSTRPGPAARAGRPSSKRSGGDDRARAREIDLLRHQLAEIDAAGVRRPRRGRRAGRRGGASGRGRGPPGGGRRRPGAPSTRRRRRPGSGGGAST